MGLAFVQGVNRDTAAGGTSATTGVLGATPMQGNLLLIFAYMQDNDAGRVVTPPAGWTKLKDSVGVTTDRTGAVFYKIAGAGEATSFTWTWTGATGQENSFLCEISGADATTPIDASQSAFVLDNDGAGFNSVWSERTLTTLTDKAWDVVYLDTKDQGPGFTLTSPSGYTERNDAIKNAIYTKEITPAGATGVRSGACPAFSELTYSFAIRPAATMPYYERGVV